MRIESDFRFAKKYHSAVSHENISNVKLCSFEVPDTILSSLAEKGQRSETWI